MFLSNTNHEEDQPVHLRLRDPADPDPRQPAALWRAGAALLPGGRLRGRLWRRGDEARPALRHQRAELRPLQNLRHQGPGAEHQLDAAGRRRRTELSRYVGAAVDPSRRRPESATFAWDRFSCKDVRSSPRRRRRPAATSRRRISIVPVELSPTRARGWRCSTRFRRDGALFGDRRGGRRGVRAAPDGFRRSADRRQPGRQLSGGAGRRRRSRHDAAAVYFREALRADPRNAESRRARLRRRSRRRRRRRRLFAGRSPDRARSQQQSGAFGAGRARDRGRAIRRRARAARRRRSGQGARRDDDAADRVELRRRSSICAARSRRSTACANPASPCFATITPA